MHFQYYLRRGPFGDLAKRRELMTRLNAIPGVDIREDALERRPNVPLSVLAQGGNVVRFLDVFSWVTETIDAS